MVIAYIDDLTAVGEQEQLDEMKASLDAFYTMKLQDLFQQKTNRERAFEVPWVLYWEVAQQI